MTSKIFKSILSVAVIVLLASLTIITGVLYQYFGNVQESQLREELRMATGATEQLGVHYLETLSSGRHRLTWVAPDGTVLFDNYVDAAEMENHADREEIKEALTAGSGSSQRHSATLTEQTIYEATRLNDGSVLRISISRATVFSLVIAMFQPIAVVLVIALILSALLANRMANRVVEPLNKLDLERPLENDVYEELSPLLHRIHAQHRKIKSQMLTLKQKQEEFDQITANMKEALILLDHSDKILSINPAARTLFGTNVSCTGQDILAIDRKQNMRLALEEVRTAGHACFRDRSNGREYQFDLNRIVADGTARGTAILAFDITEQVDAERNRREFTANVSHELKTPLQSIIGSAEFAF